MKLIVQNKSIKAFINNTKEPSLVVQKISKSKNGKIGIFVGDDIGGDFRNVYVK